MAETIYALATAPGRAGIAVVRTSGPRAFAAAEALTTRPVVVARPRLAWLRHPVTGERIDQGLVLGFAGPRSFTGEDVVEYQVHGGPAVVRSVLDALSEVDDLRLAHPGEFTRRALMYGRLDLAQVEGLGDLIAAETASQQRQALRMLDGALARLAEGWGEGLIRALAFVEATIDFSDEELPEDLVAVILDGLAAVGKSMEREVTGSHAAERIREGFEVALIGPPNVGKSTLLNALAGRDVVMTSEIAGTTRDVIEVRLDLDGLALTMLDTAGLRMATGPLEVLGISRARTRAEGADLRVFLVMEAADADTLGVLREVDDVVVLAKADRREAGEPLAVSGLTGAGVEALLGRVGEVLARRAASAGTVSHARQRVMVVQSLAALHRAMDELAGPVPQLEIAAEELGAALRALDFLLGKVDVESVLDVVFSSFCLGK